MNYVIILAGGSGTRTNLNRPKQFVEINGKPMILFTLEKFIDAGVDRIVVSCNKDWRIYLENKIQEYNLRKKIVICDGGSTGLASAYNGYLKIKSVCKNDDIIIFHDSCRPFINVKSIIDNIHVCTIYGNAMASVNCVETLAYFENNLCSHKQIPRDNLKRIMTPQSFKFKELVNIFKSEEYILSRTEPSIFSLYLNQGNSIYCSSCNEMNFKITYADELDFFMNYFN